MGNIRDVVKGLDASSAVYGEQKELIETLALLASSKADSLALEVEKHIIEADSELQKSLPAEFWLDTRKETHAIYKDGARSRIAEVEGGIKKFINSDERPPAEKSKNIVDGISNLIGSTVNNFLDADSSRGDTLERMFFYLSGYTVVRLDLRVWKREIASSEISKNISHVICTVAVKSCVDLSRVKINTFLTLYANELSALNFTVGELDDAIYSARNILSKLQ